MGTRLYPITNDTQVIETLAGVPLGTHALLETKKALQQIMHEDDWYDMINEFPECNILYDFELFGFGKLTVDQWKIVRTIGDGDCVGHTSDPSIMQALLDASHPQWHHVLRDFDVNKLQGVSWS